MTRFSVTVVVATYNPVKNKLISTLSSIVNQQGVDFEIILTDDGSEENYFKEAAKFLECNNFFNYKLVKNVSNVGTVKNLYGALLEANGEYTYTISPGDMLYDENTLKKLYTFATNNKVEVCFGNAIYYRGDDNNIEILRNKVNDPPRPWLFSSEYSNDDTKIAFLTGNYILGAAFFRKADVALKYVEKIKDFTKYVEDNTTTAIMIADGLNITHYDEYIVWYEYGTGVSTAKSKKWNEILGKDFNNCFGYMASTYSNDKVLNVLLTIKNLNNKMFKIGYLLFCAPKLLIKIVRIKFSKKSVGYQKEFDLKKLEYYMNIR